MLQSFKPVATSPEPPLGVISPPELLHAAVNFVRRQYITIVGVTAAVVALAVVYLVVTPRSYTAEATMIIDARKGQPYQQQPTSGGSDIASESALVDSQVEILRSENVSLAVIRKMQLTKDPEFVGGGPGSPIGAVTGAIRGVLSLFGGSDPPSQFLLERKAAETFRRLLTVKRVGLTYVISVSFRSLDADRAAQIANAVVEAYAVDQLDAKYETTRRAGGWLQDRIRDLRQQATNAEAAVVDFKRENNIVESGGRLTTDQQVSEVNTQIVQARATTAESKARLDRIEEIIGSDISDATVTDTLKNDIITKLRQQYLDFAAKEADWSKRYGKNHLAAVNLRNQMEQIRSAVIDELKRIAQTYRSDYEIAKVREDSIKKSMTDAVSQSQTTSEAQLKLRDLESAAQTYRAMYDTFLQKYTETVQQQSFPITEARSISPATSPLKKSHPRSLVILALGLAGGIMLGTGAGFLRDQLDRVFRTSGQVDELLHLNCVSIVPAVKSSGGGVPRNGMLDAKAKGAGSSSNSALSHAVKSPFSRFAESVRAIKVAVDLEANKTGKATKVIGVYSSLPNEGKSTVATNLAQVIAMSGARTVLVDCDLRNPSLSRALAPDAQAGILDVLAGNAPVDQAFRRDPKTNLVIAPIVLRQHLANASEIFSSERMKRFFAILRERFDYVIVDLPPLAPVIDARATAHLIDHYLFVVEWGRTKIDVAQHALSSAPGIYDQTIGVVLNNADMHSFARYQGFTSNYYSDRHYQHYGYID